MNNILVLIMCHVFGDYVLQNDFIAKTKGNNYYHLFVHCVLYIIPFALIYGINIDLAIIFTVHIIVDNAKARHNLISYTADQRLHYIALLTYCF